MDINDLRVIMTVLLVFIFIGIVWWAFGRSRKKYFDSAAEMPFTEEDEPGAAAKPVARPDKRKES